jgi:hypothetical protein
MALLSFTFCPSVCLLVYEVQHTANSVTLLLLG